jgi:hypothetical protein
VTVRTWTTSEKGRLSGPSGREHFRKGNKSSGTWPRHADENEFGARPAAADCTAPEERKAWLPCDPDAETTRATRSPSHSLSTYFGSLPSWLSLIHTASSAAPPPSYYHTISAVLGPSPPPIRKSLPERRCTWHMQPLSRHPPASLARNKKLDTALSLSLNDPSDPSLPTDTTVHIRAPLAQIDQQNVAPTPAEHSPLSRAPPEPIPPTRALGKPMPRRSSYTGEDGLYTASTSSQSPPYRRLSQYVSHFFSYLNLLPPFPPFQFE